MNLCIQNGGFEKYFSIDEAFRLIKESGFDYIDYNLDHVLTPVQINARERSRWCDGDFDTFMEFIKPAQEALKKYDLKVNQIHAPFPPMVGDKEYEEYIRKATRFTIRAAKEVGCHYVVVHEGFPNIEKCMSKKDIFDWNIEFYSSLIPVAKESDVIICLENLFSTYRYRGLEKVFSGECADMDEAIRYITTLNGIAGEERFGFCLDTGHANLMGLRLYDCLMKIGPYLKVLHIHDNNGVVDQHVFPYCGIIMWDDFIRGIRDCGYKGALDFETFAQLFYCDKELVPAELKLLKSIGDLFVRRIEA